MTQWKPLERYNGLYLVSDDGQIFSTRSNRLLKPQVTNVGYLRIELNINGKTYREGVHRLVAECFVPNPNNYPVVNHKDENPLNNHADNLEWCTQKYNMNYGTCIERRVAHMDYKSGAENHKSKRVYQFDLEGNFIAEYGGVREAERITGLASNCISKAATGILKQYAGYVWCYEKKFKGYDPEGIHHFSKGAFLMYDLQGNFIRRFDTPKEMKEAGFSQISANRVCRGERKSYKGYIFKHEDE